MNEIVACSACGLLMEDDANAGQVICPRCMKLVRKRPHNIEGDLGLAIGALILFFPSMSLPIMTFELGNEGSVDTMLSALYYFYLDGYPALSVLVFFTSIFAPFIQIIISILLFTPLVNHKKPRCMKVYFKVLSKLRHWIMLDVYLIAILVSTVKLRADADVVFGPGLLLFVFLMIFSFLLSSRFDRKQIWKVYHYAH
jgi:paraquat-inducible protein A